MVWPLSLNIHDSHFGSKQFLALKFWWVVIATLYHLMLLSWHQKSVGGVQSHLKFIPRRFPREPARNRRDDIVKIGVTYVDPFNPYFILFVLFAIFATPFSFEICVTTSTTMYFQSYFSTPSHLKKVGLASRNIALNISYRDVVLALQLSLTYHRFIFCRCSSQIRTLYGLKFTLAMFRQSVGKLLSEICPEGGKYWTSVISCKWCI